MRERVSVKHKQVNIEFSTLLDVDNLYNNNSTFFSPIYTFSWRKTYLFRRQIKVQLGKRTLIMFFILEKMPTLAGIIKTSVHFFLHGPRIFHLSTEKVRVRSVGSGQQSGYSRVDTINNNINKDERHFP